MLIILQNIIQYFFVAVGVVLGGSLFGGLGALITNNPPVYTILTLAESLKIWALVVALDGTFSSFRIFEAGIFEGGLSPLLKQILYIVTALIGAYTGQLIINWLFKGELYR